MKLYEAYHELLRRSRERTHLGACLELLGWDELTYMPRCGVDGRGEQMAYLTGLYHRLATDPAIGDLLAIVEGSDLTSDLNAPTAVNVRQWRRQFDRLSRLPRRLLEELASVTTTAQQHWAAARQDDNYEVLRPSLERIVQLKRAEAECLLAGSEPADGCNCLYDMLLQDYEPTARTSDLSKLFTNLRAQLRGLLDRIRSAPQRTNSVILRRDFPLDRQRIFIETVIADLGFNLDCGRLDPTPHPFFSTMGPCDVRITTRFSQQDFGDAFFAALHEMGHGLYEQGLSIEHYGSPYGEAPSMAIHESQSRLWERIIGMSAPFWNYFFPKAHEMFHQSLYDVKEVDFYRSVNHVQPSWNRVRADDVTYDLHILVRFELEQGLISGDLSSKDLPSAWNEKYREYLGVHPTNDAQGCLQDSHWAAGQFGYFPAYTLGNVYAAQLWQQAQYDLPEVHREFSRGNFSNLVDWLSNRVFQHGGCYSSVDLLTQITGAPPDHQALVNHLESKYAEIYGF